MNLYDFEAPEISVPGLPVADFSEQCRVGVTYSPTFVLVCDHPLSLALEGFIPYNAYIYN